MLAIICKKMLLPTGDFANGGAILIENGKILEAGPQVKVPENCPVYPVQDGYVTPGLIESHGHITPGDENEMTSVITTDMDILDCIDPFCPIIPQLRQAGFTTFCTVPGSSNLIGGIGAALKLKSGHTPEDLILPECRPLKMALGENPKKIYGQKGVTPGSRMGNAALIRRTFHQALTFMEKPSSDAEPDRTQKILSSVLSGERLVKIHCHTAQDIATAVRLGKEYHLNYTLEHVTAGRYVAEFLAENQVRCCVGPLAIQPLKMEMKDISLSNPGELEKAGVSFSLIQDAGWDTIFLPSLAGLCTAWGLSLSAARRGITIEAAKNLGLQNRIGSLEPGKDADIAIFDGDPLLNTTRCLVTFIDGEEYKQEKEAGAVWTH